MAFADNPIINSFETMKGSREDMERQREEREAAEVQARRSRT